MSAGTPLLSSGASLLAALLVIGSPVCADSIVLKNGNTIEGKIVEDTRGSGGFLVVSIGEDGRMFFRASEVEQTVERPVAEPSPREDAAPARGGFVEVRLAKGGSYYGGGAYFGKISPASDSRKLVLAVPDAGTISIPRRAIASIEPVETASLAPAAAVGPANPANEITTYHVIHLKNGRKVHGDLIETASNEQIKVRIGQLGVLIFARDEVESIHEERGTIRLPSETAKPAATEPVESSTVPGDADALREELKREVLDEILDELLDRRLGSAMREPRAPRTSATADGNEILHIQDAIRELGRQRTQNRVRAERQLAAVGVAALPYLELVVRHPLNLTRRAVQRIVRDTGDRAGAPLAIEGLTDPDAYVRQIAHGSLQKLLPEIVVPYAPNAPRSKLERAQAEYWGLWDELALEEAKAAVLEKLSRL